jgi:hypothetical protein
MCLPGVFGAKVCDCHDNCNEEYLWALSGALNVSKGASLYLYGVRSWIEGKFCHMPAR